MNHQNITFEKDGCIEIRGTRAT